MQRAERMVMLLISFEIVHVLDFLDRIFAHHSCMTLCSMWSVVKTPIASVYERILSIHCSYDDFGLQLG